MNIKNYLPHRRIPIITYHQIATTSVAEDPERMAIPPERFAAQMAYLKQQSYQTLSLDQLTQAQASAQKQVVISFDDGFADNYQQAFPILEQYGFKATIFLVTARMGKHSHWTQSQYPMLTWAQIEEMQRYGIDFQSHTENHVDLARTEKQTALKELKQSKQTIEDKLGNAVTHLAYPYGSYSEDTLALVAEAGYQHAYASSMANNQILEQSRFNLYGRDKIFSYRLQTSLWGDWLRYWRWQLG